MQEQTQGAPLPQPAPKKKEEKNFWAPPRPQKREMLFYWLYFFIPRVAPSSSKNLDPLIFNQPSPTNDYQTQKLNQKINK